MIMKHMNVLHVDYFPVPGGEVGHIAWWRVLDYSKVLWGFASCCRG